MNLHIVHKSAHAHGSASDALTLISPDDKVLFIDDGIYNTLNGTTISQAYLQKTTHCYYLEEHASARGISGISSQMTACSMTDFVDLSLAAQHNISWY